MKNLSLLSRKKRRKQLRQAVGRNWREHEYERFVFSLVKVCRCEVPNPCPCDGLLSGGPCDEASGGTIYEHQEAAEESSPTGCEVDEDTGVTH